MTDTPTAADRPILGVGQVMADVLAIFFRRLPKVLLLSLPAAIVIALVLYAAIALEDQWADLFRGDPTAAVVIGFSIVICSLGTGLGIAAAPLAEAQHSYALRGQVRLRPALARLRARPVQAILLGMFVTAGTVAPLALLGVVDSPRIGLFVGAVAIALGMYALGRWGMALPSISRDRLGFAALGRSARLGAGYRWPIAGTCFLLFLTSLLLGGVVSSGIVMIVQFVLKVILDADTPSWAEDAFVFVVAVLAMSASVSVMALGLATIRARMVEIKEPPDIADMIDVFE